MDVCGHRRAEAIMSVCMSRLDIFGPLFRILSGGMLYVRHSLDVSLQNRTAALTVISMDSHATQLHLKFNQQRIIKCSYQVYVGP